MAQSTQVGPHLLEGPHHRLNVILQWPYLDGLHPFFCWVRLYRFLVILSWMFSKRLQSYVTFVCGEFPLPLQLHHWIYPSGFAAHHAKAGSPCLVLACIQPPPSLLGAPGARNSVRVPFLWGWGQWAARWCLPTGGYCDGGPRMPKYASRW